MIRITELALPLDHPEADLQAAILKRLAIKAADLIDDHAADLTLVHLPFRRFGTQAHIAGPVQCVSCLR